MSYTDYQKEIVRAIYEQKVYDIFSFVKTFGYYKIYNNKKEDIERKFNKQEQGKLYTVLKPGKECTITVSITQFSFLPNFRQQAYMLPFQTKHGSLEVLLTKKNMFNLPVNNR